MTNQILTPTPLVKDGAGLDLTALMAHADAGDAAVREHRPGDPAVSGTGAQTPTVDVGTTVLGRTVSNFPAVTLTPTGDVFAFGPFDAPVDQSGTTTLLVTRSTVTAVTPVVPVRMAARVLAREGQQFREGRGPVVDRLDALAGVHQPGSAAGRCRSCSGRL